MRVKEHITANIILLNEKIEQHIDAPNAVVAYSQSIVILSNALETLEKYGKRSTEDLSGKSDA